MDPYDLSQLRDADRLRDLRDDQLDTLLHQAGVDPAGLGALVFSQGSCEGLRLLSVYLSKQPPDGAHVWTPSFRDRFAGEVLCRARQAVLEAFGEEVFLAAADRNACATAKSLQALAERTHLAELLLVLPDLPELFDDVDEEDTFWNGVQTAAGGIDPGLVALAHRCTGAISARARLACVSVLVAKAEGNRCVGGEVRTVWVYLADCPEGTRRAGLSVDPAVRAGQAFRQAVEAGYWAAAPYLGGRRLMGRLFVGGDLQEIDGPSIGLAAAIAVIARARGLSVSPTVAVTGSLSDGGVGRVDYVREKCQAVAEHSREGKTPTISTVVVPEANRQEAETALQGTGVKVVGVSSLDAVLRSALIIDRWERYLESLSADAQRLERPGQALPELPAASVTLVVCNYPECLDEPGTAQEFQRIASRVAALRLAGDWTQPIPFHLALAAGPLCDHRALIDRLFAQVRPRLAGAERTWLGDELREGAILGLVGVETLDDQTLGERIGALCHLLRSGPYWRTRLVIPCTHGTAEWLRSRLTGLGAQVNVIAADAEDGHFLADHWRQYTAGKAAAQRIWACRMRPLRGTERLPSAEEFFYGSGLYIETRVKLWFGPTSREPEPLPKVIASRLQEPKGGRLLVVGDGGAGKTTELLRLLFDCVSERSSSPLHKKLRPWYVPLGGITLSAGMTVQDLRGVLWQILVRRAESPPACFTRDLKTPRLLVLLDGLDEICLQDPNSAAVIEAFVAELHESSWVVATTRRTEWVRGSSIIDYARWDVYEVQDLALSEDGIRGYLRGPCRLPPERVNSLMECLRTRPDVLRNPALVYLFSQANPEILSAPLSPAILYRNVLQKWLKAEVEKWRESDLQKRPTGTLIFWGAGPAVFRNLEPERVAEYLVKVVGVLAVGMKQVGLREVDERTAIKIWRDFVGSRQYRTPPEWWPNCQRPGGTTRPLGFVEEADPQAFEAKQTEELGDLAHLIAELPIFDVFDR